MWFESVFAVVQYHLIRCSLQGLLNSEKCSSKTITSQNVYGSYKSFCVTSETFFRLFYLLVFIVRPVGVTYVMESTYVTWWTGKSLSISTHTLCIVSIVVSLAVDSDVNRLSSRSCFTSDFLKQYERNVVCLASKIVTFFFFWKFFLFFVNYRPHYSR